MRQLIVQGMLITHEGKAGQAHHHKPKISLEAVYMGENLRVHSTLSHWLLQFDCTGKSYCGITIDLVKHPESSCSMGHYYTSSLIVCS